MAKFNKNRSVGLIAVVVVAVLITPTTFARQGADDSSQLALNSTELENEKSSMPADQKAKYDARKVEIEKRMQEREVAREDRQTKLADKKLEICKKKETSINKAMKNISKQKSSQVEVFNKISARTQTFYSDKNLTVADYDKMVDDVNTKKAAVLAELENLESNTVDFKCDSDDPLKVSDAFKSARDGVVTAMKDYKTSVKDLIVAVKQASEKADSAEGEIN